MKLSAYHVFVILSKHNILNLFSCFFQNNYIKTSKYSWLTFLPLNLLEQFQRIANFYFLCLLLLQLIPAISSLTPITTAIPLIGVLALTAVKDAYDDIVSEIAFLNNIFYSISIGKYISFTCKISNNIWFFNFYLVIFTFFFSSK